MSCFVYDLHGEEAVVFHECCLAAVDVSGNDVGWLTADAERMW